jgi:hypothetical protein
MSRCSKEHPQLTQREVPEKFQILQRHIR